jgi:hypothetical protein
MKSLTEFENLVTSLKNGIVNDKNVLENWEREKRLTIDHLNRLELELYEKNIYLCHIREIFRLAKIQFSRLRHSPQPILTTTDIKELDKWVGRAKSEDGLKDIRNAIAELSKYSPSEIKSNLYALVQKIIIEGPYEKDVRK